MKTFSQNARETLVFSCLSQHDSEESTYGISVFVNSCLDTENTIHVHSGILLAHEEKGTLVICRKVDGIEAIK